MAVATIPVFSWVRDVPRTPTSPLAELLHPRMQELFEWILVASDPDLLQGIAQEIIPHPESG